jgi:hypothetical protein
MPGLTSNMPATSSHQAADGLLQRQDLYWALTPVVLPTDDQITSLRIMSVPLEVTTGKLELDQTLAEVLALALLATTSFAIGEFCSVADDFEAEFIRNGTKQLDDVLFACGSIYETPEAEGTPLTMFVPLRDLGFILRRVTPQSRQFVA